MGRTGISRSNPPAGAGNGRFLLQNGELKLDPPVNLVLPVSRDALPALWAVFGEP